MVVTPDPQVLIALPEPDQKGHAALERVLSERRSVRDFADDSALSLGELGQVLWAAQGVSNSARLRTAPSAGALYPLELYAVVKGSDKLGAGIYHYLASQHALSPIAQGEYGAEFSAAALMQDWTERAGLILVVAANHGRCTVKYGARGQRYVAIEAGHAVQNAYLQAASLGLGATEVGAFHDDAVAALVHLPADQEPVTSVVVGRPANAG